MEQVIKLITETLPADYICISQILDNGKAFRIHAAAGFGNSANLRQGEKINGKRAAAFSSILKGKRVFGEEDKELGQLACQFLDVQHIKSGICMPIRSMGEQWGELAIFRQSTHRFNQDEVHSIHLISNIIAESVQNKPLPGFISQQAKSIALAKKQWELAVDLLPQLIIALNHEAKIIRVNRTAEIWGIGKVNEAKGLIISSYIANLTSGTNPNHSWITDWSYIWKRIQDRDELEWKIDQDDIGRVFQFSLRKVMEFDHDNKNHEEQCYAVLVVDDITTRQMAEMSLKRQTLELERKVIERTQELKQANEQLEYELEVQKRDKEALKEFQICRQNLLNELITAQETERKRIACELHDSIGQSLGATKFKVEELLGRKREILSEEEYSHFRDIVDKLKNVIDEVRNIAMCIRPAMLDDLGVVATLHWFCREYATIYTGITVNHFLNVNEDDISNEMKVVIFRIVQEAMNNVAKHAVASRVDLELYWSSSDLKLCITDNGKGFDLAFMYNRNINYCRNGVNTQTCGFGLHSMCERAESTGGQFSVESIPENGTSVKIIWKDLNKESGFINLPIHS